MTLHNFSKESFRYISRVYARQEELRELKRSHEKEMAAKWRSLKGWQTRIEKKNLKTLKPF